MPETRQIPLNQILEPPAPVRASMDEGKLEELRDSIRAIGLLLPIIVVPLTTGERGEASPGSVPNAQTGGGPSPRYEIVAGHRRFLAARMIPLEMVECKVYEDTWQAKEAAMLAENAFREDVTAAEEGWRYCELTEKYTLTEAQLCAMVQQSPHYIYERMDMVRKDANVAQLVAQRKINFTVAKELLKCPDEAHRTYLASLAAEGGATGNVVKSWVAQWKAQQTGVPPPPAPGQVADAGTQPVENHFKCWCCGGDKDPQNLRLIYVHWFELDTWDRILREAGLRTVPVPAQQASA